MRFTNNVGARIQYSCHYFCGTFLDRTCLIICTVTKRSSGATNLEIIFNSNSSASEQASGNN